MSILIKGMEMPENCRNCPFSDKEAWCLIPGDWRERNYMPSSGRSEYCPLVEVSPHGRLIDADYLYEVLDGGYDLDFDEVPETKKELLRMIEQAPTIIEAEEE